MSRIRQTVLITVGTVLIAFALLVALYANEPFNIASLGGLIGIALVVWAVRSR